MAELFPYLKFQSPFPSFNKLAVYDYIDKKEQQQQIQQTKLPVHIALYETPTRFVSMFKTESIYCAADDIVWVHKTPYQKSFK